MVGRIRSFKVEGYRSVRDLEVDFDDVNLITGPNGCGKSNLFNAFRLLKSSMQGKLAAYIAEEGGMESIVWAGPRSKGPVKVLLSLEAEPFSYRLEFGLRPGSELPLFPLDPQIKAEIVKLAGRVLVDRKSSVAHMRGVDGDKELVAQLVDSESIFAQISDPSRYHALYSMREMVERWIFYHEFRTDQDSPLRRPALGTYSPMLAEDGHNLAPALLVLRQWGEWERFAEIFSSAFPEQEVFSDGTEVKMSVPGIGRLVSVRELSDGTLKFIALAVACFAHRPAPLIAFNEPEASLNPAMMEPLADLLTHAAQYSQLWITTHSEALTRALEGRLGCHAVRLRKEDGETLLEGQLSSRKGWLSQEG
ncbi:MAG TPA: AAA family ATPase [Fimbriimonas sp.]|nr:AAA family ATPase [Fimbriimonas sp.]